MWKPSVRENELKDLYLKTLPRPEGSGSSPFMIGMIGLPGTGKTHIAQIIAKELGIHLYSADKIRRFLNENGYTGNNPHQGMVEYISENATRYLLKNKISFIIDSDLIRFIDKLRRKTRRYGITFILVRVVSSEETTLNRIKTRLQLKNPDNHSLANESKYHERKKLHEKLPRKIFYTFDNENPLESQIHKFLVKLEKEV